MAKTLAPGAGLTAAAAVSLSAVLASYTPSGPWQPVSVILGWSAVVLLAASLLTGYPWGLAAAAVVLVARTGIHGLAGGAGLSLTITAALILAVIEFGGASLEGRSVPGDLAAVAVRTVAIAAGGGLGVGLMSGAIAGAAPRGIGVHLVGLAAAFVVGTLVLGLHRSAWATDRFRDARKRF